MFCPKCGKPDQQAETYCRQCGVFLPDLSKPFKTEAPPEENIKINTILSLMTVIVSFTLAILLYIFLGFRETTHPLIYATAGLLIAMGGWHIQTFIRSRRLKRQWKGKGRPAEAERGFIDGRPDLSGSTSKLLERPNFDDVVPPSVTDRTTKHLAETKVKSS